MPITQKVDEMLKLADEVAEAIQSCKELVKTSHASLQIPLDENLEEKVKQALRSWMTSKVTPTRSKLRICEGRISRIDIVLAKFRGEAEKNKRAELIAELKPSLLEKVKAGGGESINEFEATVKAAENDVLPFYRGCTKPRSE